MENTFRKLLSDFKALPKANTNPTFMDICHIWRGKFEERCSNILKFFFNPQEAHGLRGLFLDSILEVVGKEHLRYLPKNVRVVTEEGTADGKRIDLLIECEEFVIAIENKILANLYNPLDSYATHVSNRYEDKEQINVVLSVRRLSADEREKAKTEGFDYVNYQDLFDVVQCNIGRYAIDANQTYLVFLYDFIRTINNRYYNKTMAEIKNFFIENRENVERFVAEYNKFKTTVLDDQKARIVELKEQIKTRTGADWWDWQGWDLAISFNDDTNKLGIESSFGNPTTEKPIGDYRIFITVWKKEHFAPYEEALIKAYPNCSIDKNADDGKRVYMHLPIVDGNDNDKILVALEDTYKKIKNICEKIK